MSKALSLTIPAEVTRQIRQHARSSMSTEVCGVLIGAVHEGEGITVAAAIAGENAAQAGTHVTFTQDTWEHIYKVKDAEYPDERIVGWYHSHPGFGVFLSEHDTFIQQNFFSAPEQVAWVFDPHSDEEGCFGWIDGKIARLESILVTDTGAPAEVAESRDLFASAGVTEEDGAEGPSGTKGSSPKWLRWAATVSMLLGMLLLGFVVSRLFFPIPYPLVMPVNPLTRQPLLTDPKTGNPVYMDPQSGRYVAVDPKVGRLTVIDPSTLKMTPLEPPAEGNPPSSAGPKPAVPDSSKPQPKEAK